MGKTVNNVIICSGNTKDATEWSSRLRAQGFAVEMPSGGFHALSLLERENFDIMLLSDNMQDMSTMEILAIARTNKDRTQLPIICIADVGEAAEKSRKAIEQGADAYILKSNGYFNEIVKKMKDFLPK